MSFTSELVVYGAQEMGSQEMIIKSNFMESDAEHGATLSCPLRQESIEERQIDKEEKIVNTNGHLSDKANHQMESNIYFEESLKSDGIAIKFEESIDPVPVSTDSSIIEKWDSENIQAPVLKGNESEEDDEETIATFVTAAGQQLALYAVEDSDEIFAVAVYNESDEPPSNFQFLMKADVERLIGEGAVRTVKKPSQMKKRVFTAQPPMFYRKEESDKTFTCDTTVNSKKSVVQEENGVERNYETYQNYNDFKINSKSSDSVQPTVDEHTDVTYLMMDDNFVNIAEQPDECRNNLEFEDDVVEHSTVQYILLEADHQSDSELTFDEVQATLQNMKISRKKSLLEISSKKLGKSQDDQSSIQKDCASSMRDKSPLNEDVEDELESYVSSQSTINRTCTSISENDQQRLIDTLTDLSSSTMATVSQTPFKVKRSRKQQLISVDRDDGEIIIQPASMLNEELTSKKRNSRRRHVSSPSIRIAMNTKRMKRTKRIKRTKRRKVVEVIDLDVDEEEQQTTRNVVEITLDKDKYSSDKENEIIMVRDSDSDDSDDEREEEEEKNEWQANGGHLKLNGVIRCEYCSRNFRYRRTLKMHLLVCQKSPTKALNLDKRKPKGKENQKVKKQFTCKICQEKFDVVVALARHARAEHSQRKKHKLGLSPAKTPSKSLRSVQRKETTSTEEEESIDEEDNATKRELGMLARVKRKRKQRNNYSLETKKLNCMDCGRWFPSTALLDAHSLQHGTKKSEQLRKCHICKKLIRSRLLFLQHLKMHNDTQSNSGSSSRILRRKLRARPSTRKIASPRKRGRPRKF